jgi:hypothetical protein
VFLAPYAIPEDTPRRFATTNRFGEFEFQNVTPGGYLGSLNKRGFYPTTGLGSSIVDVAQGQRRRGVDLAMTQGGVLSGHVLDETGAPLGKVMVGALRAEAVAPRLRDTRAAVSTVQTNTLGEFSVEGLPPGQYVIVASFGQADGLNYFPGTWHMASARLVTIQASEVIDSLDFRMGVPPAFSVEGIVVSAFGQPAVDTTVQLVAYWPLFGGLAASVTVDADGRFRLGHVPIGEYRLTVVPPGG